MRDYIVYIAGPYRAATEAGVQQNIDRARAAAIEIAKLGLGFFCPPLNSAHMGGIIPDEEWIKMDLAVLRGSCKAMLMLEGWETSRGAIEEQLEAAFIKKPIFYSIPELKAAMEVPHNA